MGTLLPHEVPAFPTLSAGKARAGFFEREEHEPLRAALPPDEGDLVEFLYWTGWRSGEAKALEWRNVDLKAGIIRIEETKSGEPRTLPYHALPALADLIEHRREVTDEVQRERGIVVPRIFHRDGGKPIRDFKKAWISACIEAGLGHVEREEDIRNAEGKVVKRGKIIRKVAHRIPHDYRRSAARNLSRAGVPEGVIMAVCGWKTRSVFDRYRIVSEGELAEGLAKLGKATPAPKRRTVERMRKRKTG